MTIAKVDQLEFDRFFEPTKNENQENWREIMETRRQVLSGIAALPVATVANRVLAHPENVSALLCQLEIALYREVPGLKTVQLNFDPEDKKIPLSVFAFRI